jgi:predicted transposase YdaD
LPIQIIESRWLPAEENVWLKCLRGGLNETERERINTEIARQGKDAQIDAYVQVLAKANPQIIEESFMGKKSSLTFEQALENVGLTAKWEARGEARGKAEGAFAIAQNMVDMGLPLETVVSATRLEPEKVKAMYHAN